MWCKSTPTYLLEEVIIINIIVDESRFNSEDLITHAIKHKKEYEHDPRFRYYLENDEIFSQRYDDIADILSWKKVQPVTDEKARFVGFIDRRGRFCKYDREYQDYIVYRGRNSITMHKKDYKSFMRIYNRDYKKDIPDGK